MGFHKVSLRCGGDQGSKMRLFGVAKAGGWPKQRPLHLASLFQTSRHQGIKIP